MKNYLSLFFWVCTTLTFAQTKSSYHVGILLDNSTEETEPLFKQLQNEIKTVIGEDATIIFPTSSLLINNYSLDKAASHYNTLLNNEVDIILAFGVINHVILSRQTVHKKPTILFGAVNKDVINLNEDKQTSGIENFTYLITSQSFRDDLSTLKDLTNFKKVGVAVESKFLEVLPLQEALDRESRALNIAYKFIPFNSVNDILFDISSDIDAFYLAGGFLLDSIAIKQISKKLIEHKIPSFTNTNIEDVENGIMATNQGKENIGQFFRRIALTVEAWVNGRQLSELPVTIDYNKKLTINYNTAEYVGIPLKYSLIARTDFVGNFENVLSQKRYNLVEVMKEAIEKNLSLQSSQRDVDLAEQDIKTAKSNYLPDITVSATGVYIDPDLAEISNGQNPEYSTSGNATLTQTIFSDAANANIGIQKTLQKAQRENYNTDALDITFNAASAYFSALIVKTNLQIRVQNLDLTKSNLQTANQNFEAGQSGKSDVLRFRSEMAQNTQAMIEAANQLEQAFFALNQLLNNPINYEIDVDEAELEKGVFKNYNYERLKGFLDDPTLRKPFVAFLVEEAINNAPELKSLDYNLQVIEKNIKLNGSRRFLPTLVLQGQYNRDFNQWGKGSTPEPVLNDNYNVNLNLSIPIFNQNQHHINKQIAKIQRDQLSINQDNLRLNIDRSINDAVLNLINEIANIELSKVSVQTAKESLELTQAAYANGAVNIVQLLDAQSNYLQAQLSQANATYNYLLRSMELERNLGYFFLLHNEAENQEFLQRFEAFTKNRN